MYKCIHAIFLDGCSAHFDKKKIYLDKEKPWFPSQGSALPIIKHFHDITSPHRSRRVQEIVLCSRVRTLCINMLVMILRAMCADDAYKRITVIGYLGPDLCRKRCSIIMSIYD